MARLARAEIFDPAEIVAVHLIGKTVRSCYLMGIDERSGKNFDHRKRWLEEKLKHLAAKFGIDLLAFSCMSNHFHLLLRSRPDVVATWDDSQVAMRWWQLCPTRKVKLEINGEFECHSCMAPKEAQRTLRHEKALGLTLRGNLRDQRVKEAISLKLAKKT